MLGDRREGERREGERREDVLGPWGCIVTGLSGAIHLWIWMKMHSLAMIIIID